MTYVRPTRKWESNVVASEVEVPTFQLVDKIGTKSQRQFLCFGGPVIRWYWLWCWSTKPEAGNSRWRPLNSKLPVTENICLTVEIVLPSCLRTEICVFPVWRPPSRNNLFDFSVQYSYDCHWIAGYQKHRLEFRWCMSPWSGDDYYWSLEAAILGIPLPVRLSFIPTRLIV